MLLNISFLHFYIISKEFYGGRKEYYISLYNLAVRKHHNEKQKIHQFIRENPGIMWILAYVFGWVNDEY